MVVNGQLIELLLRQIISLHKSFHSEVFPLLLSFTELISLVGNGHIEVELVESHIKCDFGQLVNFRSADMRVSGDNVDAIVG